MKTYIEKIIGLFEEMIKKEFTTEIGKVNVVGCVLVALVLMFFVSNDNISSKLDADSILIMFISLITAIILCIIFVFSIEFKLNKIKNNNSQDEKETENKEQAITK